MLLTYLSSNHLINIPPRYSFNYNALKVVIDLNNYAYTNSEIVSYFHNIVLQCQIDSDL